MLCVCMCFQGFFKLITFVSLRRKTYNQYDYLKVLHLRLQDSSSPRYEILCHWSDIFRVVSNIICTLIAFASISIVLFPLIYFITTGNLEPILPIMVPGLDRDTTKGYIGLMMVHIFWLLIGACGILATDMTYIMMSLYSWPLTHLFANHVNELNRATKESLHCANTKEMRMFLRNIVQLHQEIVQ